MMTQLPMNPFSPTSYVHLQHKFNFSFSDVASAFLKKYNDENKYCMTTIAKV